MECTDPLEWGGVGGDRRTLPVSSLFDSKLPYLC